MRELERNDAERWIGTRGRRQDIPFVRLAKAGGWRTSLPANCVAKIESAWGALMVTLGYGLASGNGNAAVATQTTGSAAASPWQIDPRESIVR